MADVKKNVNVNDEYEVAVKDIRPWMVVGTDKLKGLMFAMCSTEEKAKKAKELIDDNLGGINMTEVVHSDPTIDVVTIGGIDFMF